MFQPGYITVENRGSYILVTDPNVSLLPAVLDISTPLAYEQTNSVLEALAALGNVLWYEDKQQDMVH
jgi:hypothetical protein